MGGTGDVRSLNASTPGHGSPCEGIARTGREFLEVLLLTESTDDRLARLIWRVALRLRTEFFLLESSSDETS